MESPIKYKIEVTWPDHEKAETGTFKKEGLTEEEARAFLDHLKRKHKDDEKLIGMIDDTMRSFGFSQQHHGKYSVDISGYRELIPTDMEHDCPRRAEAPYQIIPGPDIWNKLGDDLVCSYCGSLHPDTVLEIVKKHGSQVIEGSTKGYKWYFRRPEISNASLGGIKYYRQHDTKEFIAALNELIKQS